MVAVLAVAVTVVMTVTVYMAVVVTEVADCHRNSVEFALTSFVGGYVGLESIAVGLEHLLQGGLTVGEEEDVIVFHHVLHTVLSLFAQVVDGRSGTGEGAENRDVNLGIHLNAGQNAHG